MIIRSHARIYVRGTLGIRRVRSPYADKRLCTLLYAEAKLFLGQVQHVLSNASV